MRLPWLRPVFGKLTPYKSGRVGQFDVEPAHLLGANESPHDPLPSVVEAIVRSAYKINRYPDFAGAELITEISRTHDVLEDQVAVGAGSAALLQMLLQAIAEPDSEVLYAWRSFELYPILADLAGVHSVCVPLVDEAHDLQRMIDAVTQHTRLVIICNPNNPTGTALNLEDLQRFLEHVPPDCIVVLDEAYYEYMRAPDLGSGLDLHRNQPNLVILRTFSKAYGLAGLRVGYLIGDQHMVTQLRKAYLPYSLNVAAQAAALAALRLPNEMIERVEEVLTERTRVRSELLDAGWLVPYSHANFIWLRLNSEAAPFGKWCSSMGIEVRSFPEEGVRVSIGSSADNNAFLSAAVKWRSA